MFALKAAVRLTPASSQLSSARAPALRYLSTEAPPADVHEVQGKERARSIRKVSEEGGAHSQLVALAVKNTAARAAAAGAPPTKEKRLEQAKRQMERRKAEASSSSSGSTLAGQSKPRTPQRSQQPQRSSQQAPSPMDALSLLRGNAERRPFNPRFQSAANGDRSPRPPRRNSPSLSSSPNSPNQPRGPKKPNNNNNNRRQKPGSSTSGRSTSIFSAEDSKPLAAPTSVSYPAANLAQLVRADLAAKALEVKRAVSSSSSSPASANANAQLLDVDAEDAEVRAHARKVLTGDYSQWTANATAENGTGKGEKGKKGGKPAAAAEAAVQHARKILSRNPSVGLDEREVLINKLKEVL